jgi:hypothetical protein
MTDNNQDRPQDEGQQNIDRETEQRNRENETGQTQNQPAGQNQQNESAFGQKGQSAGGETNLADNDQTGGQSSTGQASSNEAGFVGSGNDNSSDYLTKGEENQDFAPEGRGAQETSQGKADVETGQSQDGASDDSDSQL